jgi:DNA mismatch repair protein MutS2
MTPSVFLLADLLQAEPAFRIDAEATDTKLVFAFSGSATGGLFADTLATAQMPASNWEPECYVSDLFLDRFVRECLQGPQALVTVKHLVRVVANPPRNAATIAMRQGILRELGESPALSEALQSLYNHLLGFRASLEGTSQRDKYNTHRQQLDVLEHFSHVVEKSREFAPASSALRRLAQYGEAVFSSEGFQSLKALLDYDGKLATIDFRVRMGADGRVRDLQLLSLQEDTENPFVNGPLRRWGAKLELLARGYKFSDGEVMARLLDAVFEGVRKYFVTLVQLLGDIEFYRGALHFKARAEAAGLEVCLPEACEPETPRRLEGLFNPLLLGAGMRPVPCDIESDRHDTTLLVTGPNSGGKTRLLQAIGYCHLLAQGGLFVPARRACLAPCSGLVVSLIQETMADQPEGRLGMELMRIRALFERLPAQATVILDELCSGTNPSEGEEIFELVVRMLAKLRPQAFITTHFLEFASRLEHEKRIEGLRFLQVELGVEQEPTYQFVPGVARTSLAGQAAARLGVTGDQLMALIDRRLGTKNARVR